MITIPVDVTNFVTMFADAIPDELHRAARVTIKTWLWAAYDALIAGDEVEAARGAVALFREMESRHAADHC